jgi:hypothetical protein
MNKILIDKVLEASNKINSYSIRGNANWIFVSSSDIRRNRRKKHIKSIFNFELCKD